MRTRVVAIGLVAATALAGGGGWAVADRWRRPEPSVEQTVQRVGDAAPLLLPSKIPVGWKARTQASRSFFTVTYTAPGGRSWVRLAIAVPNPPLPAPETSARVMPFRGDRTAAYQATGSRRILVWSEPGHWQSHVGAQASDAVPYELASDGMSEGDFLAVARSLRKIR